MRRNLIVIFAVLLSSPAIGQHIEPIGRDRLEPMLQRERDRRVSKLENEVGKLRDSIEDAVPKAAPKKPTAAQKRAGTIIEGPRRELKGSDRLPRAVGTAGGFDLPLSVDQLPAAKKKVRELEAELAKAKAEKLIVPDIDIASIQPETGSIGYLVEYKTDDAGKKTRTPVTLTVESTEYNLVSCSHPIRPVDIHVDSRSYKAGDKITLKAPVSVQGVDENSSPPKLQVKLFADH